MLDDALLARLCCPVSRQDLRLASAAEVKAFNQAVEAGGVTNVSGNAVDEHAAGLLIRSDGEVAYLIWRDPVHKRAIPNLRFDEGIQLAALPGVPDVPERPNASTTSA